MRERAFDGQTIGGAPAAFAGATGAPALTLRLRRRRTRITGAYLLNARRPTGMREV